MISLPSVIIDFLYYFNLYAKNFLTCNDLLTMSIVIYLMLNNATCIKMFF